MTFIDVTLIVLLGGFVLAGFWFGIIHMIGSLFGLIFGALAAGRYFELAAKYVSPLIGGNLNLARIISFLVIFILVTRLFGVLVSAADKIFHFIAIVPFLKMFNRLLGAAFGLIEGTLALGLAVFFAMKFPVTAAFNAVLQSSQMGSALGAIGQLLAPILPKALQMLKTPL